jgi:hypothetical protein
MAAMGHRIRDVGGTPGGLPVFLLGLAMLVLGVYFLLNQVTVHSGYWRFWGDNTFGLTLLPLLFGIAVLFYSGRSVVGWALTAIGALVIFAGIIANLDIHFRPTTLWNTLTIFTLMFGGLGTIFRSLRPMRS